MALKLMIVDDELEIREMLSRHFRFQGYDVKTAQHGKEALEIISETKIDIVISDIRMPIMDGVDLCRKLRADYPMTRVIMITGYVTLENAMACMRQGADNCVFKPFQDLKELESAVERSAQTIGIWVGILKELAGAKKNGALHGDVVRDT